MASTSFHAETGRSLTEITETSKAGDCHTLTIASDSVKFPGRSLQFTHYTLAEPVAHTQRGWPLFDLNECSPICPLDDQAVA